MMPLVDCPFSSNFGGTEHSRLQNCVERAFLLTSHGSLSQPLLSLPSNFLLLALRHRKWQSLSSQPSYGFVPSAPHPLLSSLTESSMHVLHDSHVCPIRPIPSCNRRFGALRKSCLNDRFIKCRNFENQTGRHESSCPRRWCVFVATGGSLRSSALIWFWPS